MDETAHGRTEERSFWKNEDLDLTPQAQWTWGWYDFAGQYRCQ
jgi:NCS1 family nucleobase:cation symporter-1